MELKEALNFIAEKRKEEPELSHHFKDQCIKRGFTLEEALNVFSNGEIVSIFQQDMLRYKVGFFLNVEQDLYIILAISISKRLKLITIFPDSSKKRTKNYAKV